MNIKVVVLRIVFLIIFLSFLYLVINFLITPRNENNIGANLKNTQEKLVNVDKRNQELLSAIKHTEWLAVEIRKTAEKNIKNINEKNCKGILSDIDGDQIYDQNIFGQQFSVHDSNVRFHYNFCSFAWNKQETISILATTQTLLDNFVVEEGFGDRYVPAFVYKQFKHLGTGELFVEDNVALVPVESIILN